jgi:hypothetical protein
MNNENSDITQRKNSFNVSQISRMLKSFLNNGQQNSSGNANGAQNGKASDGHADSSIAHHEAID